MFTVVSYVNLEQYDVLIQEQGDCQSNKMYLNVVLNAWPRIVSVVEKLTWDEFVAVSAVFSKVSLECVLGVKHVLKFPIVPELYISSIHIAAMEKFDFLKRYCR